MRDKGLDKGLIREFDDSKRDKRGFSKGFFGFRKMFRDYLTKLNVAYFDTCCPAATPEGIVPVRYNDTTDTLQYFDVTTETWLTVDGGAFVSSSVSVDDGTVGALALRIGADGNNGLYGVSDTVVGVAVEGAQVATFTSAGLTTDSILERTAAAGVSIETVKLEDGGIGNAADTMLVPFIPIAAAQNITAGTGGAINVTSYYTSINTDAGGDAFTLAVATQIGQRKVIRLVTDGGGDGTVTVTGGSGFTTLTFNDAADEVELMWTGTAWVILKNVGVTAA